MCHAYGMESVQIDGNDVEVVYQAVSEAAERARAGEGPTFIEGMTYRLAGHMAGDLETYRTAEEIEEQRQHEPLVVLQHQLTGDGGVRTKLGRSRTRSRRSRRSHRLCRDSPWPAERSLHGRLRNLDELTLCRGRRMRLYTPRIVIRTSTESMYQYDGRGIIMRKTTYIQAINEALREEMRRDDQVFLIGEDIGAYGGLFRVTRKLLDEFGPERVLDTPISEQGFMGMAVGAATVGMRPVVELMYMDFFLVCADQIFNQAAKMHYMTGGLLNVPMVIRGQHGGGKGYGSQHSQSVESVFAQFPGIKVVAPSTPYDAKGLLHLGHPRQQPGALSGAQDALLHPRRTARSGRRVHGAHRRG